ncbi:MAG TPA: SpoIIE family protein phosphatase [Mycobacteriales bacterium]|nr:SpoIIE family protein phosphatase [Mycobacteriales bacterium]
MTQAGPARAASGFAEQLQILRRWLPQGQRLPEGQWRARHRGILVLLWAHAAIIPPYALAMGYSLTHSLLESLVLPTAALVAMSPLNRSIRTASSSLGLLSASGVLVHLSGGLIEMHFHFFVMVAVVALYQDWIPFLAAIGYVFVHHGLIGVLDPHSVYNHAAAQNRPWMWAGIHALFIAGTSAACLVTWRLNEDLLGEHERAEERLRSESRVVERLHQSELLARTAAEEAAARLALLAEASKAMATSLEMHRVLGDFARLVVPVVADHCAIDLARADGSLERVAGAGTPPPAESPSAQGEAELPVMTAIRTRAAAVNAADGSVVAPLLGHREVLGVLTLVRTDPSREQLTEDDVPFVEDLAQRVAGAVENAQLYARQRSVAETLQHSLLPERLPRIPGLTTAARYLAGGPGVEVGGDWYDVVQLRNGHIGLAIGDVVGRGERAAALMGNLRSALRAFAIEGREPAELMRGLNAFLTEGNPEQMATALYVVLDPETGDLRYVNAGHPPPLVTRPDGTAEFLEGASGVPVGALSGTRYKEGRARLETGQALVLYTDGLVEDRSAPIEEGLERLRGAVLSAPGDLELLCTRVLDKALGGRESHDDAAILAVQVLPLGPTLDLQVPADPTLLAPLRATMRRWLAGVGASPVEVDELLVASGELFANAIRHPIGVRQAQFAVHGEVAGEGEVTIAVKDQGRWRQPRPEAGGGRGLDIVRAFCDSVEVTHDGTGTTVVVRRRLSATAATGGGQ